MQLYAAHAVIGEEFKEALASEARRGGEHVGHDSYAPAGARPEDYEMSLLHRAPHRFVDGHKFADYELIVNQNIRGSRTFLARSCGGAYTRKRGGGANRSPPVRLLSQSVDGRRDTRKARSGIEPVRMMAWVGPAGSQ